MSQILQSNNHQSLCDSCGFSLGTRHWACPERTGFGHFGLCALSCDLWCRDSMYLKELSWDVWMACLFLLCGVWMWSSLSPGWQPLRLSTDVFWLLIYDFGPSLLSHVYTVHMWKLFQWFVTGNTVSASISPNQYASSNTTDMSGRTLASVKVSKGWTKSKPSSCLTIPEWYLWSGQMLECTPVYWCYIVNSSLAWTTQWDLSQNKQ